ncbi:carbohydrate ABC transporter permease [Mediterraneibacter agrestimuris]|uniref:carbohydrate ABC transporter permease n=1 Tax=Mediterraneibacter agrestimuris TaxID=2941333 RepID=UPI00203C86A7|nr:carbohydrate ABC transporter permease [Mediterraneibacter agrestimuris]
MKRKKKQHRESRVAEGIGYIVFILTALAVLIPMLLLVIASFTDNDILNRAGYSFFPEKWSLDAYKFLFTQSTSIIRSIGVSIVVTTVGTTMGLFFTMMLAYALSRDELPGRRAMMFFVVFTLLFNGGMVPTYFMYVNYLHVKNTMWGLLLPNLLVNGFNVLLMRTYFRNNVPKELLESARIDGAGEVKSFFHIVLPISTPILATIGMLIGVNYWNDWYNGMLYVTDPELFSMQSFLNKIMMDIQFLSQTAGTSDANSIVANIPSGSVRMAMAFIATIPVVVIFCFVRKYFAKGLTVGSVKG